MKSKLTLSIDPEVLVMAKQRAKEMKISISALLEDYLRTLTKSGENTRKYKASKFLKQIPAKEPSFPYDSKTDDQWLGENLEK